MKSDIDRDVEQVQPATPEGARSTAHSDDFEGSRAIHHTVHRVVSCSPQTAFDLMTDFGNDHLWWATAIKAERTPEGPIGVGTRFRQLNRMMGRHSYAEIEVTAYEPVRYYAFHNLDGLVSFRAEYHFAKLEDGRLLVTMEASSVGNGWLYRLANPLLRWHMNRVTNRYWDNLRRLLNTLGEVERSTPPV